MTTIIVLSPLFFLQFNQNKKAMRKNPMAFKKKGRGPCWSARGLKSLELFQGSGQTLGKVKKEKVCAEKSH
jgi:hypothetical protein